MLSLAVPQKDKEPILKHRAQIDLQNAPRTIAYASELLWLSPASMLLWLSPVSEVT